MVSERVWNIITDSFGKILLPGLTISISYYNLIIFSGIKLHYRM